MIQDYVALTKPRITFFCLIMTICGVFLVQDRVPILTLVMILIGTGLSVGSANAFNMIYERNVDKLMMRTRFRPLPAGRIKVFPAIFFAFILSVLSIFVLWYFANFLTAISALFAILFYAFVYTPLKMKTPLALVIGAIPGAMAPLLGFTAIQNKLTLEALAVFGILFAWQMPHFIAIAMYAQHDYQRAGFKIVSIVRGPKITRIQAFLWSIVLFVVSLLIVPLHLVGKIYFVCALTLNLWFLVLSAQGVYEIYSKTSPSTSWPKKFFLASLIYLPLLVLSVVIDRLFAIG